MEVQQLRHLLAAVEHGHLGKAADECNISQPGLSRSIRSLEERLGVQLLDRGPKGVTPTPFGSILLKRARVAVNELTRATEEIRVQGRAQTGELTFGITQNYAHYLMPPVLTELHRAHPKVRYTVVTGGAGDILEKVRSATIDFGFGVLCAKEPDPNIVVERIRPHSSPVVARAEHPLAAQSSVSFEDLAEAAWIMSTSESIMQAYNNFFITRGFMPPTPSIQTDSLPLVRKMILSADLITAMPAGVIEEDLEAGRLVTIDCGARFCSVTAVGFVTRADGFVTPQMTSAINSIRKVLTQQ